MLGGLGAGDQRNRMKVGLASAITEWTQKNTLTIRRRPLLENGGYNLHHGDKLGDRVGSTWTCPHRTVAKMFVYALRIRLGPIHHMTLLHAYVALLRCAPPHRKMRVMLRHGLRRSDTQYR